MLMTTGTRTKNPVTNLRRSHDIIRAPTPPPIAASSATPSTMRYHAKGAKPDRADEPQKRFDDEKRRQKCHDETNRDLQAARRRQVVRACRGDRARTPPTSWESPRRTRTPRPPAARAGGNAADDRRARARDAGDDRQALTDADAERARQRRVLARRRQRARPQPFEPQHDQAADDERDRPERAGSRRGCV